jgi:hypothetical protein
MSEFGQLAGGRWARWTGLGAEEFAAGHTRHYRSGDLRAGLEGEVDPGARVLGARCQ